MTIFRISSEPRQYMIAIHVSILTNHMTSSKIHYTSERNHNNY